MILFPCAHSFRRSIASALTPVKGSPPQVRKPGKKVGTLKDAHEVKSMGLKVPDDAFLDHKVAPD
ncbi:MAG: hypothetical protein P4L55_04620 [Syntrophobacteraceae bacterium]|nr:hypothetical protein [Syntrophobacteraceae bacterium]